MDRPGFVVDVLIRRPVPDRDENGLYRPFLITTTCPHGKVHTRWERRCHRVCRHVPGACGFIQPDVSIVRTMAMQKHARDLDCACALLIWMRYGPIAQVSQEMLHHIPLKKARERDSMLVHLITLPPGSMVLQRPGMDPERPNRVWWRHRAWTDEEREISRRGGARTER